MRHITLRERKLLLRIATPEAIDALLNPPTTTQTYIRTSNQLWDIFPDKWPSSDAEYISQRGPEIVDLTYHRNRRAVIRLHTSWRHVANAAYLIMSTPYALRRYADRRTLGVCLAY